MSSEVVLKSLVLLFSGLVLATLGTAAHAGEWDRLGSRKVAFGGDHDTIVVTAAEGVFNAIRLEVDKGDLELWDVVVTFGDGEKFSPATRFMFDQGTHSRVIDLPGASRVIRKVDFFYKSKLRRGHATMSLFGRHPTLVAPVDPVVPVAPVTPIEPRWDRLGERQVKFRGERDVIPVTVAEGTFKAIKLEIDSGDLELYDVVVTFGNGETFSPTTRFAFREGSMSRTIDLPGDARVIKKVEFRYRSTLAKGRAKLVLWGLHP